jgi:hypothetical protein
VITVTSTDYGKDQRRAVKIGLPILPAPRQLIAA